MRSWCVQESFFCVKILKYRSTFGVNIPYSEKTVLLLQNSKTKSTHQSQFSSSDFALYRLIFSVYSKIAFFGSILSDTYSMKFCDAFWKMNFSIFNKGEQKKLFFTILLENQWNEIIMHLTARLLIQIPRSKSKFGVNIPLSEKTVFYLSNLRQQRLLNFSFDLNFLLRKGQFFWVAYSGSKGSDLYSTKVCKDPY